MDASEGSSEARGIGDIWGNRDDSITSCLLRRFARTPDACALRCGTRIYRYGELDEASRHVAAALLAHGVLPGARLGILLPRGFEAVAALVAALRLHLAYVPFDAQAPLERLQHMRAESGAFAVLGDAAWLRGQGAAAAGLAEDEGWIDIAAVDHERPAALPLLPAPDDLLCVLYTSGSTGLPKGVELTHRNVLNLLQWMQREYALGADDVVLHKTPLGFDVSMYELFWPLIAGTPVVLAEPGAQKDPARVAELIREHGVTAAHFVPSMLAAFVEQPEAAGAPLRAVFAAGEALSYPLTQRFYERLPGARLHNLYGPTEAGVVSYWECPKAEPRGLVPIGRAVANTALHVLGEDREPVAPGEEGELWVGGVQLARGYAQREDLTAERFVEHPRLGRLYRTGDVVRQLNDGALEYRGRRDHQVKLGGVRIELGEIEAHLASHAAVAEAVVAVRETAAGAQLVAWYRPREGGADEAALRTHLAAALPPALLPQRLIAVAGFPQLPNGKIDRRALPAPARRRPTLAAPYRRPAGPLQQRLAERWQALLELEGLGADDPFFELGGNSLLALQFVAGLRAALGVRVPLASFFAQPTIAGFAALLERQHAEACARWLAGEDAATPAPTCAAPARETAPARRAPDEPIAIVGMACRVPGAEDIEAFWQLLVEGREGLRDLDEAERAAARAEGLPVDDPAWVKRRATIEAPYAFDAEFFGETPRAAALTDPQQRVLLECAWHALEHAGLVPGAETRIGVYVGLARNHYFDRVLATHEDLRRGDDGFSTLLASDKDYAATRIAYKLDLRGPALTLQTACSSSGVALHLACQAIRAGDCDAAIVGGARINVPDAGYLHVDGGPQSARGRDAPFSAEADGMVLGSGVACLVLKRLSQAEADGDRVYALVRGTAVNNDGADKAGYTVPAQAGQLAAIRAALEAAGVAPETVGYVEAHGTGTPLGDPIEVAALAQAYAPATRIALGSVKGNIGHLDAGAGAIGLIKAALMLERKQLVPSLHCETPNADCALEETPFFINAESGDWAASGPRRAAVSSFGFGGTNFHGLLEEAAAPATTPSPRPLQLLRLSAKCEAALREQARRLAAQLRAHPELELADVAYTLDRGRARLPLRACVLARDTAEAAAKLEGELAVVAPPVARPSLVYVFPGQGAQHADMGRSLYVHEPVFREAIDRCAEHLREELDLDLRQLLYPGESHRASAVELLKTTEFAQPAIFAVAYAGAQLWASWGLAPAAMVGHSLGEFVAATLAGVFELEDALAIIAARGRLLQDLPPGGMLAARLSEAEAQPYLADGVALAGVNAPRLVVLSGPREAIDALEARLAAARVGTGRLHTSHAFHSPMMDPAVERFAAIVARYPRRAARLPIVSTLSGGWASAEDLREPFHWARQLREPVRFAPAVLELLKTPGRVFLEIGPGQSLSAAVRQAFRADDAARAIAALPHAGAAHGDAWTHLLGAAGELFGAGIDLGRGFYGEERRCKLALPGYPFARTEYRVQPASHAAAMSAVAPAPAALVAPPAANAGRALAPAGHPARARVAALLRALTGLDFPAAQHQRSFLELGLDSLTLTQLAGRLKAELKLDIKFRRLLDDCNTIARLADLIEASESPPAPAAPRTPVAETPRGPSAPLPAFGAGARISKAGGDALDVRQARALEAMARRYEARTGRSKAYAQRHRAQLADPRTASGFRPLVKELVYPIVVERSEGPYLWDLDGNRYVDASCGFGSMFFGHKPRFVQEALAAQLQAGWEIGPQTPLAGECAELFTRCTGLARVAFCNTGSEAVIAATRLARTVTGRELIVSFAGDYHGIHDEVIVRAGPEGRGLPAAPGIPASAVASTLVLDYGSPHALEIIRERAHEIAGVLVEPVQSRHPELQPREFLHALRTLTRERDIALIFDEVITGFRAGLRGAQDHYGVEADIATYGKVFGGGMPIGAVAGSARFLDALDGGHWQYGDDSVPEAGVTYFAGTFVRHPLTLAAVRACLHELLAHPERPAALAARTQKMVARINDDLAAAGAPLHLAHFASLWKPHYEGEPAHGDLLFFLLRERGIHIWEGRPCFLSLAHGEADCDAIVTAFRESVAELQAGGLLERRRPFRGPAVRVARAASPPLPGARIGRDAAGNPAWFIPDPQRPGKYLQLQEAA